jgi:V8-like Glu-specific endopeptidase
MRAAVRALIVVVLVVAGIGFSAAIAQVKAGDTRPYFATTPHPYPVGDDSRPVVWTDRITSTGATFLRLHFVNFDLAPGDYVTIRGPHGEIHRYEGKGPHGNGEFWSFSTDGDWAVVQVHGGRGMGHGYTIDRIGHGTLPQPRPEPPGQEPSSTEPVLEVICGTDGRKDVACYTTPPVSTWNPIARLLFVNDDDGFQYVCTGWLVNGSNANTLMTNNHCIDTQSETSSLQARFNYQKSACKGNATATAQNFNGGTFLITSPVTGGLDYSLLTLQGNPEGTWGEYTATTVEPSAGSLMYFPQHPGGGLKKLGKFEDKQNTIRCDVTAVNQTFGGSAAGSQFSYGCDSEGGSSGSPILNDATTRVWGLHHFGGVNSCNNSATHMSDICSHAGSLLNCSSTL